MPEILSVSSTDLEVRREKLRRNRQIQIISAIWRSFAITGLAVGLLWFLIQPIWVLKSQKDITVSGNHLLSDEAIQSKIKLSYPKSLWRVEPSSLSASLKQQPGITRASVTRRVFPPGLKVEVSEIIPVAITQTPGSVNSNAKKPIRGLVDINGAWVSLENYKSIREDELPLLELIGELKQCRPFWKQLYQAVSKSSVAVMQVDCRDPNNIILRTELGLVHIGNPASKLPEKIKLLAKIRRLPAQVNMNQIEFIDLSNTETILVQMNHKTVQINSQNN
ncbi:cell division septal protein [Rivularia sp. PCC 7116]|uniref:cell division protein FtsQ/DivIB n=1 Tax=Rivularia sp. PCC 7116 TaxID=373994 RepID=UPI00029ED7AD|nr:FtsQ-type POTRA domain-containing protein [Rivularia sp. PCC 7116]AFY53541.1 cell division septal protein [Rivularia sp. PCC 7116]